MSQAFDISDWQGRPSLSWFRQMKAAGYDLCWVQLWGLTSIGNGPSRHAEYQLFTARQAGMRIGGYIVIYGDDTDETGILVRVALDAAGQMKSQLEFVALDVETAPIRMERLLNAYDNIGKQLPGRVRPMYTSRWKWTIAFGTTPWPQADESPLLEARYWFNSGSAPATPPDLEWMWLPFGGWTERAMLQYAGTVPTFGVGVDRCVYNTERMKFKAPDPIPIPEPEPEGDFSMGQYEELKALITSLAGKVTAQTTTIFGLARKVAALESRRPAPAPAPTGKRYVTVKSGDLAGNWFATEAALLKLNPNFKTLAYRSDGSIMRRFANRSWSDIYPPESLRVK